MKVEKVKYFSESVYYDLFTTVQENFDVYINGDKDWVEKKYKNQNFSKESRLNIALPSLNAGDDDLTNVLAIHNAFNDKITPKQASNPFLWTYLTHCEYWEYSVNRWCKTKDAEKMSIKKIRDRFFCKSESGNRIGFLRNSISRLWWFGYLTYQENTPAPYVLTELMLSNSDLCQSIVERNFSMNKEISIGILCAIKEINDNPSMRDVGAVNNGDYYEWRQLCMYINRYGGVALLDTLTRDDIKELSYEFIMNYRKKWGL